MIRKNSKYGETNDVVVAEMGTGDVHMLGSEKAEDGSVHLAFRTTDTPKPINVIVDTEVKSFDEFKPDIVFIFHKVKSIDSLINMLKDCRKEMMSPRNINHT